jgi:hypothetical protein
MLRAILLCLGLYIGSALASRQAQAQCAAYTSALGSTTACQGMPGPALSISWHPGASCTATAYQWQTKVAGVWTNISGANSSTYVPSNATATSAVYYRAQITVSSSTVPVTSDSISITVNPHPPVTMSHSGTAQICPGTALCASVSPSVSYQWALNSTPIVSATGPCFAPGVGGTYTCMVSYLAGSIGAGLIGLMPAQIIRTAAAPVHWPG